MAARCEGARAHFGPRFRSGLVQRRGFHQALERGDEPWIDLGDGAAATAFTAHLALRQRPRVEIILAAIDRRSCEPGDPRYHRQSTPSGGPHLARREQSPAALVELAADRFPSLPNGALVDHATDLRLFAQIRNPSGLSHTDARPRSAILLLFALSLALATSRMTMSATSH